MNRIVPVVLCGGSGIRLWPLSRASRPKPFLVLDGGASLLRATLLRFSGQECFGPPLIVGGEEHGALIREEARECGVTPAALLLEPASRNTAPAIGAAAAFLAERDRAALMLVMPADHRIGNPAAFAAAVRDAVPAAEAGWLVTFGIAPDVPETGYGYIEADPQEVAPAVRRVRAFVEKPDRETALRFLEEGRHLWNSGIFLFRAEALLAELRRHAPEVSRASAGALVESVVEGEIIHLGSRAFSTAPCISIDRALMQRSERVAVRAVTDAGWSDVGSWSALHAASPQDMDGNAASGDALFIDARGNFAHLADGRLLLAFGTADLVIVSTPDAMLVTRRDLAQEIGPVVERLRAERPDSVEGIGPRHEILARGAGHRVTCIRVRPCEAVSRPGDPDRARHWVVAEGGARIMRDGAVRDLRQGESIDLPRGCGGRIENVGRVPLVVIEVAFGAPGGGRDGT